MRRQNSEKEGNGYTDRHAAESFLGCATQVLWQSIHPNAIIIHCRVFENTVLRRIFGPKRDEVTGEWRKLHNEDHKVHHPRCVHKLTRLERMYLSNTTLFDGIDMYRIYCIKYSYMFRRLTPAIFRLYMKCLVSSYTYSMVQSPS